MLSDFKLYYKATIIKQSSADTKIDTEIKGIEQIAQKWTYAYKVNIFGLWQRRQRYKIGGIDSFVNKLCWENWTVISKGIKLDYFLTLYKNIHSKGIKDLNVKSETIKFLEENMGSLLFDITFGNVLSNVFSQEGKQK